MPVAASVSYWNMKRLIGNSMTDIRDQFMKKNNGIVSLYHILVEMLLALSYSRDIPHDRIARLDWLMIQFKAKYLDKSAQK
jgi:hypothetical protein